VEVRRGYDESVLSATKRSADRRSTTVRSRWQAASEYGIDVTLLERNLELTVTERLEQLEDMLRTYYALRPTDEN